MLTIHNLKENDCEEMVGTIFCKCFNKNIEIVYDKNLSSEFINKSVKHLENTYPHLLTNLCKYTMNYCKDFINEYPDVGYDDKLKNLKNDLDILNYIQIDSLRVESCEGDIILNISGGCIWAEEKGFQWIIQGEKIVYVGPWYDFDIDTPDLDDPFFNYCTR